MTVAQPQSRPRGRPRTRRPDGGSPAQGRRPACPTLDRVTRLPSGLADEVQDLLAHIDQKLDAALALARHERAIVATTLGLLSATAKGRATALRLDPELAPICLGLRVVGERLLAIGGTDLLEDVVRRATASGSIRCVDTKRAVLRGSWHCLGPRGAEFIG